MEEKLSLWSPKKTGDRNDQNSGNRTSGSPERRGDKYSDLFLLLPFNLLLGLNTRSQRAWEHLLWDREPAREGWRTGLKYTEENWHRFLLPFYKFNYINTNQISSLKIKTLHRKLKSHPP